MDARGFGSVRASSEHYESCLQVLHAIKGDLFLERAPDEGKGDESFREAGSWLSYLVALVGIPERFFGCRGWKTLYEGSMPV